MRSREQQLCHSGGAQRAGLNVNGHGQALWKCIGGCVADGVVAVVAEVVAAVVRVAADVLDEAGEGAEAEAGDASCAVVFSRTRSAG